MKKSESEFVVKNSLWVSIRKKPISSVIVVTVLVFAGFNAYFSTSLRWEFWTLIVGFFLFVIVIIWRLFFPLPLNFEYRLRHNEITYRNFLMDKKSRMVTEELSSFRSLYLFQDNNWDQIILSHLEYEPVKYTQGLWHSPYLKYDPNQVSLNAFNVNKSIEEQLAAFEKFAPHLTKERRIKPILSPNLFSRGNLQ